jgi:hypothetical protein
MPRVCRVWWARRANVAVSCGQRITTKELLWDEYLDRHVLTDSGLTG